MTQNRHREARNLADLIGGAYDIIGNQLDGGAFAPGGYGGGYPAGYPMGLAFGADDPSAQPQAVAIAEGGQGMMPMMPQGPWGPPWVQATPYPNATASLIAARNSFLVAPRAFNKARKEFLGFPQYCLKPCQTITLVTQPQVIAKLERIVIPSTIAAQLRVLDIKIGKWSMFANGEGIPALMLSELATDVDVNPDTAQISTNISITVQNTSRANVELDIGAIVKAVE